MSDNAFGGAQKLGKFNQAKKVQGFIGASDRSDTYQFSLRSSSSVSLNLGKLKSSGASLELLNSNKTVVARSSNSGKRSENITRSLDAGSYFIRVRYSGGGKTKYELKVATASGGPSSNSGAFVADLKSFSGSRTFQGQSVLSSTSSGTPAERADTYRFTLSQAGNTTASLSNISLAGNLNLKIFRDENNNGVFDESNLSFLRNKLFSSSASNLPLLEGLLPGTYFLEVTGFTSAPSLKDSPITYDLNLAATPENLLATDPGPDSASAFNLGSLQPGGTLTTRDYAGILDRISSLKTDSTVTGIGSDVYRFNIISPTNVRISFANITSGQTVNTSLFRDVNGNGILDPGGSERSIGTTSFVEGGPNTNTNPGPITTLLSPGTYFLAVGGSNTIYSLLIQG